MPAVGTDVLELCGVSVALGGTPVLRGVDLEVGPSEIVGLLGASGSGKSTILRVVAGLEQQQRGEVRWSGSAIDHLPAHRREFGMVFQDHVLFAHRDVAGNVELGLRLQGRDRAMRRARVAEMLALVGLAGYECRRIATLSGGEQQRVALARALAPSPKLLLFDEPFGALDRPLRDRLVADVGAILHAAAIPAIVVTHDHDEAFALSDRVAVLVDGRIVQCAAPSQLWRHPADEQVASLIGIGTAVDAQRDGDVLDTPWGRVPDPGSDTDSGSVARRGDHVRVVLRPDALSVADDGAITAIVRRLAPRGDRTMVEVAIGGAPLVWAETDRDDHRAGDAVRLRLRRDALVVFPETSSG